MSLMSGQRCHQGSPGLPGLISNFKGSGSEGHARGAPYTQTMEVHWGSSTGQIPSRNKYVPHASRPHKHMLEAL